MKLDTFTLDRQSNPLNHEPIFTAAVENAPRQIYYKTIPEHLCCDLDGETVILSLESGKYYGINTVGTRIWELLESFIALPEIERAILSEYSVSEEICRQEVAAFLELMLAEGLIEARYESSAAIS